MKILRTALGLFLGLAMTLVGQAQTLSGTHLSPSGASLNDTVVNFTLSQAGISPATFAIVPGAASCGTDSGGALIGITRPLIAPVAVTGAPGTVPVGTYYIRTTFFRYDDQDMPSIMAITETQISPQRVITVTSTGKITITAPTLPDRANGYRVYMGTVAGTLHLQASTTSGNTAVTTYASSAAAPPTGNDTVCSLTFNDAIIPSYTWYRTSMVLPSGANAPGFPQNWYLAGASVDISSLYPLASVANATKFPTPLLANPSSNAQQSVNSPVTLNDYALTAGALRLRAQMSDPACTGSEGLIFTNAAGVLTFCQNGANVTGILDWFDSATTALTGNQLLLNEFALAAPADGKHLIAVYDGMLDRGRIISYDYDATMAKPLSLEASQLLLSDQILNVLTTTDAMDDGFFTTASVNTLSDDADASRLQISYDSTATTQRILSTITGSGTARDIAISFYGPTDMTVHQLGRFAQVVGITSDLMDLILVDEGDGTSPIMAEATMPLVISRDQDNITRPTVKNYSAGATAQAEWLAMVSDSIYTAFGMTGTGFAGAYPAQSGYLASSNGLFSVVATRFRLANGAPVVADAAITLGADGNFFVITGNTTIGCIDANDWPAGSVIYLEFNSNPTITNEDACGASSDQLYLAGTVDMMATAASTLTLVHDGSGWVELARSIR